MGRRTLKWGDKSVGGGRKNRERQFRGKVDVKQFVRIMTEAEQYNTHTIEGILPPDPKTGEERAFSQNCSKVWSDEEEDFVGECVFCDEGFEIVPRFIVGLLLVALKEKGSKTRKIDPESSPHYWDFGADKFRSISSKVDDLAEAEVPKTLRQVELSVDCTDANFQKCDLNLSLIKQATTKDHIKEWKKQGEKLLDEATSAMSLKEQKRSLKPKKPKKDKDEGLEKTSTAKRRKKREEPEEPDDDDSDDYEQEDGQIDDLLSELEED